VPNPEGIGGKSGKIVEGKNCPQQTTAESVAKETGVSPRTIKNDAKLVEIFEKIQAEQPELPRKEAIRNFSLVHRAFTCPLFDKCA
jgi:predicted DNA-binding transcriptional regulator YafY